MRYKERQLEDIDDRVSRISMAADKIKEELREKKYAAEEEYSFNNDLDLIISEAVKLEMELD